MALRTSYGTMTSRRHGVTRTDEIDPSDMGAPGRFHDQASAWKRMLYSLGVNGASGNALTGRRARSGRRRDRDPLGRQPVVTTDFFDRERVIVECDLIEPADEGATVNQSM